MHCTNDLKEVRERDGVLRLTKIRVASVEVFSGWEKRNGATISSARVKIGSVLLARLRYTNQLAARLPTLNVTLANALTALFLGTVTGLNAVPVKTTV